ncbi:hypothetical protein BGK67_10785 [Streptomyces subrutilus]|uniref:Uncharacterized protein n=1 Tax=Streptomyces subrutilus TaxID=36818 RepID=A0A1E5PQD8_9ACTN|nr:hypothetical protein BGK67_10785 [Streptomyces subrutilus]
MAGRAARADGDDVEKLRRVGLDHLGGDSADVIRQVGVLGEDVAGRGLPGHELLLALALHPEPQLNRGAQGQFHEVVGTDGLLAADVRTHECTPESEGQGEPRRRATLVGSPTAGQRYVLVEPQLPTPRPCETDEGGNRPWPAGPRKGWVALYLTRRLRVAAYLVEERRHDPHSVIKELVLP